MVSKVFDYLAIVFGVAASLIAVLAVAIYEGYAPSTWGDSLTPAELGSIAALLVVAAVGVAYYAKHG